MEYQLSNEQKSILSIISTFGCVDVKQIQTLFSDCPVPVQKVLINQLISRNYISLYHDSILVNAKAEDRYDKDTIACIWAMLAISKDSNVFLEAIPAKSPSKVYFTVGNKSSFEMAYYRDGKILTLQGLQERIKSRKGSEKFGVKNWGVIVVSDKSHIATIKEVLTDISYIVALINEPSENGVPSVKLYKKTIG